MNENIYHLQLSRKSQIYDNFLRSHLSGKKLKCLIFSGPSQTNGLKSKFLAATLPSKFKKSPSFKKGET